MLSGVIEGWLNLDGYLWMSLDVFGCLWMSLDVFKCCWVLNVIGWSCMSLGVVVGCCWMALKAECHWVYLNILLYVVGCHWVLKVIGWCCSMPLSTENLQCHSDPNNILWHLLTSSEIQLPIISNVQWHFCIKRHWTRSSDIQHTQWNPTTSSSIRVKRNILFR